MNQITIKAAKGIEVLTKEHGILLDCATGAQNPLGHCDPDISLAIREQLRITLAAPGAATEIQDQYSRALVKSFRLAMPVDLSVWFSDRLSSFPLEVIYADLLDLNSGDEQPKRAELRLKREHADGMSGSLVYDETDTAFGRAGFDWAMFQRPDCLPDVVICGNAGAGLPLWAVVGPPGADVGSTQQTGNPVAMAAGLAALMKVQKEGLADNAIMRGEDIKDGLSGMQIVGHGLALALDLESPEKAEVFTRRALGQGVWLNHNGGRLVKCFSPVNITEDEAQEIAKRISAVEK